MMEFFKMGGYAGYIWSAYGISALTLVTILIASLRANKAAREQVWALEEDKHVYKDKVAPASAEEAATPATPEAASQTAAS